MYSTALVFICKGNKMRIKMAKMLKFRNQSVMAADLCTVWYAGLPLCVCTVCTLHGVSSSFLSLSLSHSQLVLSRGIHPSLLPPFLCCPSCSLYLSLSLCPLLLHPSLLFLPLLLLLLSKPPFLCHFPAVHVSRRGVADRVCVHIEDGSVLRCRQQTLGTSQAGNRTRLYTQTELFAGLRAGDWAPFLDLHPWSSLNLPVTKLSFIHYSLTRGPFQLCVDPKCLKEILLLFVFVIIWHSFTLWALSGSSCLVSRGFCRGEREEYVLSVPCPKLDLSG